MEKPGYTEGRNSSAQLEEEAGLADDFDGDETEHFAHAAWRSGPIWLRFRRQVLAMLPTLLFVSFFIFLMIELAPGDAAEKIVGENSTPERIEAIRQQLRLDDPLPLRWLRWLGDAVQGDLGTSLYTGSSVTSVIVRALPLTFSMILVTIVFTLTMAAILGVSSAMRPGGIIDRGQSMGTAVMIAIPSYVLGLILVSEMAVKRRMLPAIGYADFTEEPLEWLKHLIIPAIALGSITVGEAARQLRTSLAEVLDRDYILTARAKGLTRRQVILKHGLKNALMPVVTVLGSRFALMIGGTVLLEAIVAIPGIGSTLLSAVAVQDFPLVTGIAMVTTLVVLVSNIVVDLLYAALNPRLRAP